MVVAASDRPWLLAKGLAGKLDVFYAEDDRRVRNRNAAESLGVLRRIAEGLKKQGTGGEMSGHGLRQIWGWQPDGLF